MAKPSNTPIQPVSFTDKAFRSRTILLDDGRSFAVINRAISSDDDVLIAHLDQRLDFERLILPPASEA
ncbi:hypothetical protein [Janthinobacterium sp. B9-8]|uniref:hypothetical protein n=1 Tax=Janthinobacterium sp. B9-8 TaxID=1236179 RepID=UPI00061D0040|nr:hypothetical protein [Janthinobacterium sp. B9-8]AMC35432.1 hypothetical protein VN23_12815 [Janthinobacterium sp. B9-8]